MHEEPRVPGSREATTRSGGGGVKRGRAHRGDDFERLQVVAAGELALGTGLLWDVAAAPWGGPCALGRARASG